MSNYSYIKVDFYGQFVSAAGASDTVHRFTYPVPMTKVDAPTNWWLDPITDPRNEIKSFNNADCCYKLLSNAYGTYYSLITPNRRDARGGMVVITVMVENGRRTDGRKILNLLDRLKTEMLDADVFNNELVEACLEQCGFEQGAGAQGQPARLPSPGLNPALALRFFTSPNELAGFFTFPLQEAYKPYIGGILFADIKYKPLQDGRMLPVVTAPLKRIFHITKPNNCHVTGTANADVVEGTPLRLTFKRDNYISKPVKVVVGQPDALVTYSGSEMIINEKDGIVYYFPVVVKVLQDGKAVSPQQIKVNGSIGPRPINFTADLTQQACVGELFENDLAANMNAKVVINVSGSTFDPVKREVELSQIAQPIVVNVVGRTQQVTFYHVAGGLRFSLNAEIKEGSPDALSLRNGRYRGHVATRNADGSYNLMISQPVDKINKTDEDDSQSFFARFGKWIAVALVTLMLLAGGAAFFLLKGCGKTGSASDSASDTTASSQVDTTAQRNAENNFTETSTPADKQEDIDADLDFLKKNDNWQLAKIKTATCQVYYNLFADGDINGIINSDYMKLDAGKRNGYFEQIADRLKELNKDDEKAAAARIMREMAAGGSFNIKTLLEKLRGRLGSLASSAETGTGNSSAPSNNRQAGGNANTNANAGSGHASNTGSSRGSSGNSTSTGRGGSHNSGNTPVNTGNGTTRDM